MNDAKKIVTNKMVTDVQLLAVNAIYFKGAFVNNFDKHNTEKMFYFIIITAKLLRNVMQK